jgi:hypothetical protein
MEWKFSKKFPVIIDNIIVIDYKNLNKDYPYKIPIKIKNGILESKLNIKWLKSEIIKNEYSNIKVHYSKNNYSNKVSYENEEMIKIKDYINFLNYDQKDYKYVFHKFVMNMKDLLLNDINIQNYINNFDLNNLSCKLSEFYLGGIFTGTHLHKHIDVINFLIYGKKLWIIIPPTSKNKRLIKQKDWNYLRIKGNVLEFYNQNIEFIIKNFDHVFMTYQESGEIIYLPKDYFHLVINFSENIGFTLRFPFK